MRIAISGFGRIGKMFLRAVVDQNLLGKEIEIVAINTRSDVNMHAHLFKYDSTFGKFNGSIAVKEGNLFVNDHKIQWVQETDPLKLPWKELEIDLVLESSGEFTTVEEAERHIKAGAKFVLISAPAKGCDSTIIAGVNEHKVDPNTKIFSIASCTTNCLAPVLKVLDERFGIEKGFMSTIHAYTNDQRLLDGSHKDLRRARSAVIN
ncbi:aldehyde dehydrogenase, partial [Candidatus Micrarchaeota archaeon]|nr:aldehyde dehydrogenase [Candidatus Micrarchaeota archaeon]